MMNLTAILISRPLHHVLMPYYTRSVSSAFYMRHRAPLDRQGLLLHIALRASPLAWRDDFNRKFPLSNWPGIGCLSKHICYCSWIPRGFYLGEEYAQDNIGLSWGCCEIYTTVTQAPTNLRLKCCWNSVGLVGGEKSRKPCTILGNRGTEYSMDI